MSKTSKQKVSNIKPSSQLDVQPQQAMSPWSDMERYFSELENSIFGGRALRPFSWPFGDTGLMPSGFISPKVDVIDGDKDIRVRAEIPGIDKKDVDINVSDRVLTIKAEHSTEEKEEKENYYRREISKGSFSRSVMLPEAVDIEKADAQFKDGILEITLPKAAPTQRRNIKVS